MSEFDFIKKSVNIKEDLDNFIKEIKDINIISFKVI